MSGQGKRISLDRSVAIGVDVASEEHAAFIRGSGDLEIGPLSFSNDRSGYRVLASKVEAVLKATGAGQVVLALEPTGPYGEALARWAVKRGWGVVGVLGSHTSRAKELWGNSPLGECGDLPGYPRAEEVVKFCGLNLVSCSSGKRRGRNRISKRGSRRARQQLYLLAGRLARRGSPWRAHYERLRDRGAARKEALIALSRKALRGALRAGPGWHRLRGGQPGRDRPGSGVREQKTDRVRGWCVGLSEAP